MTTFSKSQQTLQQARLLVQNTQFPVVLGFEYYPVVVLPKEQFYKKSNYEEKGLEVSFGDEFQNYSPGQLIIYPLVPLSSLKISDDQLDSILKEATSQWLQSKKILDIDKVSKISASHVVCIDINANLNIDLKEAFDAWTLYFAASLLSALPAPNM